MSWRATFPELKIVMSHGGYPFVHEAIYACYRNGNVYMDISEYEAAPMCETYIAMKSMIADKVVFASAHPFVEQGECLANYAAMDLPDDVRERSCIRTPAGFWIFRKTDRDFRLPYISGGIRELSTAAPFLFCGHLCADRLSR